MEPNTPSLSNMQNLNINIGIVDDDQLLVDLLRGFLSQQEEFNVLLTASNGLDCLQQLEAIDLLPDIILLDLRMAEMDGIELLKHLKEHFPLIKTIIISSHYQDSFLGFMFKNGIAALLPKGISPDELLITIHEVYKNGIYFQPQQIQKLREQISSKAAKPKLEEDNLTEREIAILKLIAEQKTAKEIAEILFITQRTVEGHKNNLFLKTGTKNIAGLVLYGIQNHIINLYEWKT